MCPFRFYHVELFLTPSSSVVCFNIMKCSCSINDDQLKLEDTALTKAVLENTKCFLLDCGAEIYVWVGRVTQMEDRKTATKAVEVNS
jgi:hypothetical protein